MKLSRQDGFSLLELLVAAGVALTFALAGWSFQRSQARELSNQSATIDATDATRAAMAFLATEIRQAGYDPRQSALVTAGSRGIREARAERLLIEFDANGNGTIDANAVDPNAESILYSYDATDRRIGRTVGGVDQTLVSNVPAGGFVLEYLDTLGNVLTPAGIPAALAAAQRDLVASVRVSLRLDADGTNVPTQLRMRSRMTLRN
ncbi:MAG: PilW family protein, partial [Candidatus Binatia bacterium]